MTPPQRLAALAIDLASSRPGAVGDLMIAAMEILLRDLSPEDAVRTFARYADDVGETIKQGRT